MSRTRDRDSAGRLLRVIADCELFHMEAAIANLDRVKPGIRSESLLKPGGGDAVDMLERTAEGRVLSLSDHKRIARLQAALTTVANAYDTQGEVEATTEVDARRNLVCTVAGVTMIQATRDCTASRANCCIWGPLAEKLHVLLDWMVTRENADESSTSFNRAYVQQLLLEWIQPTAEKQNQLAACLALFELQQRRRRKLLSFTCGSEPDCLLGDRVGEYLNALRAVVERGTVHIADSHRVKPSMLALIALEAMSLVCGDVAGHYMISDDAAKYKLVDNGSVRTAVGSMRFFLKVLRQWHLHSTRRQFLGYALLHLQTYVEACDTILGNVNGNENTCDQYPSIVAALDVLCWHWDATAPLLCTRSDTISRMQQSHLAEILVRVLKKWTRLALNINEIPGVHEASANPEMVYAQLRYVCVLMDSIGGFKGCLKVFESCPGEWKTNFVFLFVQGLSTAVRNGDDGTVLFVLKVIRGVLLPNDKLNLLSTQDQEQGVLSQLLRLHYDANNTVQSQAELEFFVADFIISREIFITELLKRAQDSHTQSVQGTLSLVRTFLFQLDGRSTQTPLYRHWRQQLTPVVLSLIHDEHYRVRQLALSCLPSLDVVSCIAGLCATGIHDTENHVITSTLGYLFATSTQYALEAMVSWFIDACQFGSVQAHSIGEKFLVSPSEWNAIANQWEGGKSLGDDERRKELQEKLLSLCFGPKGWSNHVQSSKARSQVFAVLLRKIFGSPRDTVLLRMLREFIGCGWVDRDVFGSIGSQITGHMMSLQRLSEEFLDDNSSSAAKAIEGLLFSRLAPLLVLRMFPRNVFGVGRTQPLLCGCEGLDHLNEYIDSQQQFDLSESETTSEVKVCMPDEVLFHILARSVVDPLEFKEVKMLATEALAKFPPPHVMPFVLACLVAFVREATPPHKRDCSVIVDEESVPNTCGLVTAKLVVYYLNRVFSEDELVCQDDDIIPKVLIMLVQILGIPGAQGAGETLLTDLQRGCIDCFALLLSRLTANDGCSPDNLTMPVTRFSSLLNLLMTWIFGTKSGEANIKDRGADDLGSTVQTLLETVWIDARRHELPLQVRICCCNVLLSSISRSQASVLTIWKNQGFISRVALATKDCSEDAVVAGGLQIIFSFLYKASDVLSMEDIRDLQLVRICFDATAARLESTRSESVAMNGLKVVGAVIGKLPAFIGTLPPAELQRLIDRCLIMLRDRQVSPVVSELAQSLLQAMSPP